MTAAAHAANPVIGAGGARSVNGARPGPPFPDDAEQGIWACGERPLPPQLWAAPPGGGAPGGGFGQGGVLEAMPPGPELGLLLPAGGEMAGLDDGELTGVLRGWRRMGSWAAAMEHAAAAELVRRRIAEAGSCGARSEDVPRYAAAEVAAALTLTSGSADGLMGRAVALSALPATWAALAAGRIDMAKALVILNGVCCVSADLARVVEAQVVAAAGRQTTGELRKAVAQAVIAAGPAAADARVTEAQKSARVERWAEPSGTAAIAGRDLPAAEVLAAGNRVSALAAALKADGAPGGIDLLRAQVFLGLLLGRPVAAPADGTVPGTAAGAATGTEAPTGPAADTAAGATVTGAAGGTAPRTVAGPAQDTAPGTADAPAAEASELEGMPTGLRRVAAGVAPLAGQPVAGGLGMAGSVNLTVPLRALLGQPSQPAEVTGFGPVSPSVTRELLAAAQHSPAVRWCVTVTGEDGRATGHGCATRVTGQPGGPGGWALKVTIRGLETGECSHARESAAYRPPPLLRHVIQARHKTCTYPGCGRAAPQCDLDHSLAYEDGGRTCECNLAPLCRAHHKVKQAEGWRLKQRSPGMLEWVTPSGWRYTITPSQHPI